MVLELRFYDPSAGCDAAGVPCEVTRVVTLDLPVGQPSRFAWMNGEAKRQAFADLLAALSDDA
jgi:hypothetical protein